ncbi:MAG: tetratricopeptide repeat protein [Candidatus Wallbacteria bacterium]|nr:tetratricopeptide repeat protein [Candidatus Wallbacteria bacterium]
MKQRFLVIVLGLFCGLLILEAFFQAAGLLIVLRRVVVKRQDVSEFLILCLGDSFTYGFGVEKGSDYPALLEKWLNEHQPNRKFRVVNAGVGGINSRYLLDNLPDNLARYKPDLVTIQVGGQNRMNFTGYDEGSNQLVRFFYALSNHSRVLRLFRMLYKDLKDSREDLALALKLTIEEGRFAGALPEILPGNDKNSTEIVCSIDYFRLTGEVWDLIREKNFDGARKCINSRLESSADDVYAQGWDKFSIGNFAAASEKFREGLRKYPGSEHLLVGLGFSSLEEKKLQLAFEYFKKALQMDSHDTGPMLGIGQAYFYSENYALAERWFARVMELDPGNGWAYNFLGSLYFELKEYGKAEKYFRDGIRVNPEMPNNYTSLGEVVQLLGRLSEACSIFEKAIQMGTFFSWEESELNRMQARAKIDLDPFNNKDLGKKLLLRAIELDPSNTQALVDLGWFCAGERDYQKALEYFERGKNYEATAWIKKLLSNQFNDDTAAEWLEKDLDSVALICGKAGLPLLFLNYPEMDNLPLRKVAQREGIPLADLTAEFGKLWQTGKSRNDYFLPDRHCNLLGNLETARILGERILALPDKT